MLHQIITSICGLALYTHANACSITLKQATVQTNQMLNRKIEVYKNKVENSETVRSLKNEYTETVFYIGNLAYKKEINLNWKNISINMKPNNFVMGVRWTF